MIKQAPEEENIVKEDVKELDRIESPKVSKYYLYNIFLVFSKNQFTIYKPSYPNITQS